MSDSVRPHRRQPIDRLPRPWDSPGKNTGVGCHCLLQCMKVKSKSEVAQSCPTPGWTAAHQAPLSMGFSRREYWSGVPWPSPPWWLRVKNPLAKAGDTVSIPGSGKSSGEGNGTHSSILAWRIPWTEEPGGLQSTWL